jgi:predicted nucleotidyltransferase
MTSLRFGLKDATIEKLCGVFANHPQVEKAVIYGSRAKGNYKNGSDIDLTLHGSADLTTEVMSKILNEIDDLLLPYTIDLSIFRTLKAPDFIEHIERVGLKFYEKEKIISE